MNGSILSDKDIGEDNWGDGGIVTYKGNVFFPMNPNPADVDIEDIAHGLAYTCRFGGQIPTYYSVAEHCINVSLIVPERQALAGLLHDSPESYLTDIPRPFKPMLKGYKETEEKVLQAILKGLNVDVDCHAPEIKAADNMMLAMEQRAFMPKTDYWPYILTTRQVNKFIESYPNVTFGLSPKEAEEAYLRAWSVLSG